LIRAGWLFLALLLTGCAGQQSSLDPSGPAASEIAVIWWAMFAGALAITALVLVLLLYATFRDPDRRLRVSGERMIGLGGVALPVVGLSILIPFSYPVGFGSVSNPNDAITIDVQGRQFWWQVDYTDEENPSLGFSTANEIRIPVGRPVRLSLTTADVIHSFWVPRLAGKLDMIPGRTNTMYIKADEPGLFRGQCAEFCGIAHAQMAFYVIAKPAEEYDAWAARQREGAREPKDAAAERGAELFKATGCVLCHTVRGHGAYSREGPDLTNMGGRKTIGAGMLANTPENMARWIAHPDKIKPGNRMPSFSHLDEQTRRDIAHYLMSLK
jgi:cytochrome c oxidase subunit II